MKILCRRTNFCRITTVRVGLPVWEWERRCKFGHSRIGARSDQDLNRERGGSIRRKKSRTVPFVAVTANPFQRVLSDTRL